MCVFNMKGNWCTGVDVNVYVEVIEYVYIKSTRI